MLDSDLAPGVIGFIVGASSSITVAVNFSAVETSFLVEGALSGRFLRTLSSEFRTSVFSFRRAVRLTSHLVRARMTA